MLTKKQQFNKFLKGERIEKTLFRPILMHFAARYAGYTYGELASDFKVLVESNMKAMDDFDIDMAGLISDPSRPDPGRMRHHWYGRCHLLAD